MAIQLSQFDFDRLATILSGFGEWQTVHARADFINGLLAGSPRRQDIAGQLDLDGAPQSTAVRVIQRLMNFGQDQPGREALGVLINKLIASLGGGEDANFLRDLLDKYEFVTMPVATRGITGWRGKETEPDVAEKIIGENTLRDVYVLEILLELSKGVARIQGPQGLGTGFLIADDLLITNNHVISTPDIARQCAFQFNYQLDRTGRALPLDTRHALDGGLFITSPIAPHNAGLGALDYTIVQLTAVPNPLRLPLTLKSAQRDSRVTIIQHPGGDYKKISFQNNFVEYVDEFVLQYTTSTEPGSSGSPVLNEELKVTALHHSGGQLTEPLTKRRYLRNEGVCISAILRDLRERAPAAYQKIGI